MSILTVSQLKGYQAPYRSLENARSIQKSASLYSRREPDIFLSHSHTDIDLVLWVTNLLKTHNETAWVDWKDPAMPEETEAKTALILREKITNCKRFMLLATNSSLISPWVSWELGYADSKKGMESIAILPIKPDNTSFSGNEYMRIYPSISITSANTLAVFAPGKDTGGIPLSNWLK